MAKSLRASSKLKARNNRRFGDNTDYAVAQAARLNSISQRLKERTKGPTVTEQDRRESQGEDGSDGKLAGSKDGQDEVEVDEEQGWYICFEVYGGRGDKRELEMEGARDSEGGSRQAVEQGMDLELLGLVDPDSICLSDDGGDDNRLSAMIEKNSPVEWMFGT